LVTRNAAYPKALIYVTLLLVAVLSLIYFNLRNSFSSQIRISEGQNYYVNIDLPFVYVRAKVDDDQDIITLNGTPPCEEYNQVKKSINLEGIQHGELDLEFSLWGIIPLRNVTVNVMPEVKVMPGGQSIGIQLQSQGVIVVDFYEVSQEHSPAREAGLKKGDTIISIEDEPVSDVNHAAKLLERASEEGEISLTVKRKGREIDIYITPQYETAEEAYRIGIYIRDTAAGVGTLSFYHPESGRYGALGHIIIDAETREPVDLSRGYIVNASIVNIVAAERGRPGEKTGIFEDDESPLGYIDENTSYGIFGQIKNQDKLQSRHTRAFPVALASEVEKGSAQVLTVIENQTVEAYDIKIKSISPQKQADKNMIIKITDKELLDQTGGIIQGMSGSPIIQDGQIIGAVTHVFVNDPRQGYGIFMESMIQKADLFNESP